MQMLEKEIPCREYPWTDQELFHKELTCRNHRGSKYLTKCLGARTLHYITRDPSLPDGQFECPCPLEDLVVIGEDRPEHLKQEGV